MIRPSPHLALQACVLSTLLTSYPACAQDGSRSTAMSSWRTTVQIGPASKKPPASALATASISTPLTIQPAPVMRADPQHEFVGLASYYWQGQKTANGEQFDKTALTAAHRTLPFGTRVRVTNTVNGRTVIVRINDRGPFKPGRVIDVSDAAAEVLGFRARGLTDVRVEIVD